MRLSAPLGIIVAVALVAACTEKAPAGVADGGNPAADGGSAVDGGSPAIDGGGSRVDGGAPAVDGGGSAVDGGSPALDGGASGVDGGSDTLSAGCGTTPPATGTAQFQTTDGNGITRDFELQIPPGYDSRTPVALTFVYHGAGGNIDV